MAEKSPFSNSFGDDFDEKIGCVHKRIGKLQHPYFDDKPNLIAKIL
jgi:hypothetical protein